MNKTMPPLARRLSGIVILPCALSLVLLDGCRHRSSPQAAATATRSIAIDVFPTRSLNQFLPGSAVPIEVDVLSGSDAAGGAFRAEQVEVASLRFGPGQAGPIASSLLDVDGDGDRDLRVTFSPDAVALTATTEEVVLTGRLVGGAGFAGEARIVAVSLDPDDASLPLFTYYSNVNDSRLLSASFPDGTVIDYEGVRDDQGRPLAVRNVNRRAPTGEVDFLTLDESGRPTRLMLGNGVLLGIEWIEAQRVVVSFRSPGFVEELRAVIDLGAEAIGASFAAGASAARDPAVSGGYAWTEPMPLESLLGASSLAAGAGEGEASVLVTRCGGVPVNDALRVEVVFSSGFSTEIRQATLRGDGVYVASLPVGPGTFFSTLGEVCGLLTGALGLACESGVSETLLILQASICPVLGGAAAVANPALGVAVAEACPGVIAGLTLYCETLGQGPQGGESLGDLLCARLGSSVDSALASDNLLSARAILASSTGVGTETFGSLPVADVPLPGPLPQLAIDVGSASSLDSPSTSPPDPAALESYVFRVAAQCVPPGGVTVVLSISGTDGYEDTTAVFLGDAGVASLFVPGGEGGVVDTLRATMFQSEGGQILDQVSISIVF